MYFELTAPNQITLKNAFWSAEMMGLDPMLIGPLTFNIGTGNIEKVSRIRDKFNLTETFLAEYQPTGYTRS